MITLLSQNKIDDTYFRQVVLDSEILFKYLRQLSADGMDMPNVRPFILNYRVGETFNCWGNFKYWSTPWDIFIKDCYDDLRLSIAQFNDTFGLSIDAGPILDFAEVIWKV